MSISNPKAQADALIARGRALLDGGDLQAATDLLNQAVKLYWAAGEQYSAAAQIGNYGWALRRKGRADLARPYLIQAADLFAQLGLAEFAERHRAAAEDLAASLSPEFLAGLPPAVRGALERADGPGLQFALDALPAAEQSVIYERLVAAGVISDPAQSAGADDALRQFEPLLQAIAAIAHGDLSERHDVDLTLQDLERKGWRIRKAVHLLWQGQRRLETLTHDLDEADTRLVRRVLEILGESR